jgi:hypothetical protein
MINMLKYNLSYHLIEKNNLQILYRMSSSSSDTKFTKVLFIYKIEREKRSLVQTKNKINTQTETQEENSTQIFSISLKAERTSLYRERLAFQRLKGCGLSKK